MTSASRIGLDFGGVIVRPVEGNVPLNPGDGMGLVMPGAFEAITELVSILQGNVWIISKASRPTQAATRAWLSQTGFYRQTGFSPGNITFCEKRSDKAALCRAFHLTHFVDDHEEVLEHLAGIVPNLYLFGSWAYPSWSEVVSALRQAESSRM